MAVISRASKTLSFLVDIKATYRFYKLQESSLSPPAKPTSISTLPPTGWTDTEPTYTEGSDNKLYTVDLTVYTDETFEYKDVMLSSAYEAAKDAYNKAVAAQDAVEGMEVGGRNLARKTGTCGTSEWARSRSTAADGVLTLTPTTSSAYGKYKIDYLDYDDYKDADYTLSFDARYVRDPDKYSYGPLVAYAGINLASRLNNTFSSIDRYKSFSGIGITEEWARYSITFNVPETFTYGDPEVLVAGNYLTFQFASSGSRWPIQIRKVKLERGTKATDWTPAPEDVDEAIKTAQQTADGKNSVYYSATQPSATGKKENDIWFDTAHGNKMYFFDGSAWVAKEFGQDAIAANSIVANHIVTGAVTSAAIAANAITAEKLSIGTGGNLYHDYDAFEQITDDIISYLADSGVTASIVTDAPYYGTKCLKIQTDSGTSDGYVYLGHSSTHYGCIPVESGKKYRVSAYMRASSANTGVDLYAVGHTAVNDANSEHTGTNATIGTAWERVEFTYTASTYPYISVRVDLNRADTALYVDAIQIEEVATDTQTAGVFKPASGTIVNGSSILIGSKMAGWTIDEDKLENADGSIFLSSNSQTEVIDHVTYNMLSRFMSFWITNMGYLNAEKAFAEGQYSDKMTSISGYKMPLGASDAPWTGNRNYYTDGRDVIWKDDDPYWDNPRLDPTWKAVMMGNSGSGNHFTFANTGIFAEIDGESLDLRNGLQSKTLAANTDFAVESGAMYAVVFWHNNSATCRGLYLFRGGQTNVLEIKAASAITITLTASVLKYAYTGGNVPGCYIRRV